MKTCLQIAGLLQVTLALAHFGFARRFGWREELQRVSTLTRQIFWVHTGFIMLVLMGIGSLSLFYTDELIAKDPLARPVLAGFTIFWTARWFCQFFVYRPELWRGNKFNTRAHFLFGLLWTFLAGVYLVAFWHNVHN